MASVKFACVVVLCMVVVGAHTAQGMTCGQVQSNLVPCVTFLQNGGFVPAGCCNGVRNIMNSARSTADRRGICNCLKTAAGAVRGLNPNNAQALPGKCGVNIPYKISTSTNCARYISFYHVEITQNPPHLKPNSHFKQYE
ncbi:non-specific lipid-transfer protein 1-like [Phaseolus vulgaris]|uniref:non-specific lipid-transfer protein 1-like n=1 Tax=Phaseolus vulgaris TaxID=3885 RepID=UPI0035CC8852